MSVLAVITDIVFMAALAYAACAGAALSYLGMGFSGRTGFAAPAAFLIGLCGIIGILYYPHFIPHLFDLIPLPNWS